MRTTQLTLASLLALALVAPPAHAANLTAGMTEGKVSLQSGGPLAFGPEGILFAADTRGAQIFAIATGDTKPGSSAPLKVEGINQKIAATLGASADQVIINDLAVNPISRNAYLSVSRGRGPDATAVLLRVGADGKIQTVSLDKVKHSVAKLPNPPPDRVAGEGKRQSNPRAESITDIGFLEDRLLVAGLSNEEFASTLRAIPFPFKTVNNGANVEIYHGAHGKFETKSPVRTFTAFNVGGKPHLLAAYTCTPLVQFPISDLKPDAKVMGRTIAELGNRNRPLDMIVYHKDGKDYLLLANSSRGIMKITTDNIEKVEGITTPVGGGGTKGLSYQTIEAWKGVEQLDRLDDKFALVIRQSEGGALNLESLQLP
ncbi:MAG: hypothetical protein AB1705_22035 [Verrucomicrobiota bacterium]